MMRIIDLSLPINNQMRGVRISPATQIDVEGYHTSTLQLYSHCGTHMDAPRHFLAEGATLDRQALDVCVGDALVIDLTPIQPRCEITPEHLTAYQQQIRPGSRLLLRTDWHKHYGTDRYRDQLPRISRELARWLVSQGVVMVGVEPPSVADVNDREELTEVHQTLFRGGVLIIEGLANLDRLSLPVVQFVALPLLIPGGDGSPVRAIAIEREDESMIAEYLG